MRKGQRRHNQKTDKYQKLLDKSRAGGLSTPSDFQDLNSLSSYSVTKFHYDGQRLEVKPNNLTLWAVLDLVLFALVGFFIYLYLSEKEVLALVFAAFLLIFIVMLTNVLLFPKSLIMNFHSNTYVLKSGFFGKNIKKGPLSEIKQIEIRYVEEWYVYLIWGNPEFVIADFYVEVESLLLAEELSRKLKVLLVKTKTGDKS